MQKSKELAKKNKFDNLSRSNIDNKFRNHGMFVGFAQMKNNTKFDTDIISIVSIAENAGSPSHATNIAKKIFDFIQKNRI